MEFVEGRFYVFVQAADHFLVEVDEALEHLNENRSDDEHDCGECPMEVVVATGQYAKDTIRRGDTPSSWWPLDVWVNHQDLGSETLDDIVLRIQQCQRIAEALNR